MRDTTNRAEHPARRRAAASPTAPARAPRVPFAALLVVLVLGGMGLLLLLNTASAANELDRHGYAQQDETVSAQVEQLQTEIAADSASGNLDRAARALGMVPAGNPAFLVLGPGGGVTVRGSAVPVVPDQVTVPKSVQKNAKPKPDSRTVTKKPVAKKPVAKKPVAKKPVGTTTKTKTAKTKTAKTTDTKTKPGTTTTTTTRSHGGHR